MNSNRKYSPPDDLNRIQGFISQTNAGLHPGDFAHRLYNVNRNFQPSEIVRLWEDDRGTLLGWMMLYPRFSDFDFQAIPDEALMTEMLAWAEQNLKAEEVGTDVFGSDVTRRRFLEQHGYQATGEAVYHLTARSLAAPISDPSLPAGFTIRSAAGVHEAGRLAEVHAGAFGSSWTPESYAAVMQTPGYHLENELVVVAPDGRFAAFCVLWFDPIRKTGLFEPVGVHADFQRRGLGRALMLAGMRRMVAARMDTALVGHEVENPASTGLYHGLGFEDKDDLFRYRKRKM